MSVQIINRKTKQCDSDPFAQSDRNHAHRKGPGKGDANRSIGAPFRDNFPRTMGRDRKPGKQVIRYR